MRMKKLYFLAVGLLLQNAIVTAQPWMHGDNKSKLDFYQIQEKFKSHWEGRPYVKGNGFKQFKRWENFMEPRVYPTGIMPSPAIAFEEYKKFQNNSLNKSGNAKSNGNWQPIATTAWTGAGGWNPGLGRINVITVDPSNSSTIYIGTPAGGLWKSMDNGDNWLPLTDKLAVLGVSAVAVDPTNSDVVYIGTGDSDAGDTYGIGLLKSIDAGATWELLSLNWDIQEYRKVTKIVINQQNPNIILAATNQGLWRTADGGIIWEMVRNGDIRDLEIDPTNGNNVYASSDIFFTSIDGGLTFDNNSDGLPSSLIINRYSIAIAPSDPSIIYALAGNYYDDSFNGLYKSVDFGVNFILQSDTPNVFCYAEDGNESGGQSWYDMALTVSPTDPNTIYIGGINVWKSADGGVAWEISSHWIYPNDYGYTHADIHTLEYFNGIFYCGSDGGIFESADEGENWENISEGLQISQFYRMAISEQDPYKILLGAQDNGMNLVNQNVYTHLLGGDGNGAAIDYTDDQILYTAYQLGSLQKSVDGGFSFIGIEDGEQGEGNWVTPFVLDPFDHNILYAGYSDLWKYNSAEESWAQISENLSGKLDYIEASPAAEGTIYISSYNQIFRTQNGGENWENINNGLPNLFITSIESDPSNADKVWISFSGYNDGEKVYVSENGGTTWENISGNFPNIPANCVAYQEGINQGIYVGTDVGIYYKDNTLPNWITYMDGLPNVIVRQLQVDLANDRIVACTFGRGVWESDLYEGVISGLFTNDLADQTISLYPVPSNGNLNIQINNKIVNGNIEIALCDLAGKQIEKNFYKTNGSNTLAYDVSRIENGVYFLRIGLDGTEFIKKLIVQKQR